MKQTIFLLSLLSILLLSCKEEKVDLSGLENEIESLKDNISNLQSVISLQSAFSEKKIIVSITNSSKGDTVYNNILFEDNSVIILPDSIINSIDYNREFDEYTITLTDGKVFVFNKKEPVPPVPPVYPTGLVVLTSEIKFLKNMEVSIDFRVNPSNAVFNYDVNSEGCQIEFDMVDRISTYSSYVTTPERCFLTRIEQAKDANGEIKQGQYRAFIRDNGRSSSYKYTTAFVLSTVDKNGDDIQLSSSAISIERKKDTGLPVVIINTENKAEILDKENWITANMMIDGIGEFENYEGTLTIRGRGNSTWLYPKKPFALKLDTKSEILGMPSHKRWVLLANYMDRTLMRNRIAFEIAKKTGLEWTVRGQYVEVVLNGIHIGNYYLCEHIKIDENRVNIAEMSATDLDEESITGGYLLEFDRYFDEVNKFRSEICDLPVMIKEPENIQPQQFDYIENYINTIERLLHANNFAVKREYASYIADTTFIDWWFVMELTHNHEAQNPGSCYYYKDRSDVLKMGPVWDFDWGTFIPGTEFCAKGEMWFPQLFKDPVFVKTVKERWAIFKPSFEEISILIEKEAARLATSVELNDELWILNNSLNINGDERMSHRDAAINMRKNYDNRIKWFDAQIALLR